VGDRVRLGVIAAVATELLYGCSFAFTKNATETIDPFTLLGWRFFLALLAMLVLIGLRVIRLRITRATLRPLLVLAAFQPILYYATETFGVMRTTASESGLIIASLPVAIMVTSLIVVRRRPSRWQVGGIAVTLAGVIVTVIAGGLSAHFDPLGYAMLLAAVFSYALYAAFVERYAQSVTDIDKTFAMVVSGAVIFGTIAVAQHGAQGSLDVLVSLPFVRPDFAVAIAYLALGSTIGAFFLQNVAIGQLGSTRFSTFVGLSTLATLLSGALALGERLSPGQLIGGGVILIGVYVANRRHTRSAARGDPTC
jgi:drug/metabolite transporter (DMT)-like permease